MGKPAARLGDMTAHGGSLVIGFPTVLIGGMPAARIGDMHVCPMLTPGLPPIPHVGGPVSLGSPTVLIGGMPAARMGDMLVCVGPPDSIVMGCPTVLIGEAGGSGGSGGGSGGGGTAAAQTSAAIAQIDNNESVTKDEHWVEFQFVDKAGNPVSGVPYKFTDTESKESKGVLRLDGKIRRDDISEGQCEVQLFNVSNAKWSKDKVEIGEKVKMTADVEGFEDGTEATIEIYKRDVKGSDVILDIIKSEVKNSKIEAEWVNVIQKSKKKYIIEKSPNKKYSVPLNYFEVIVDESNSRSGFLNIIDTIEIEFKDEEGNAIADEDYIINLSNGETRTGQIDANGYLKIENVPHGHFMIKFPNLPSSLEDQNH